MQRDLRLDGLKFILIFLVVLGHIPFSQGFDMYHGLMKWIYAFHMPMFVFVSGYLTSQCADKSRRRAWLTQTICLLVVTQMLHILLIYCMYGSFELKFLIHPLHALWYILSLTYWRAFYWTIGQRMADWTLLTASLLALVMAALVPIDAALSFQRTFLFAPFFMLGVIVRRRDWIPHIERIPMTLAVVMLLLFSWIALCQPGLWSPKGGIGLDELFTRLGMVGVALGLSLALFRISRLEVISRFARFGQASLWIYIGHGFFRAFLSRLTHDGILHSHWYTPFLLTVLIIIIILMVRRGYVFLCKKLNEA